MTATVITDLPISPRRYLFNQVVARLLADAKLLSLGVLVKVNPRTPAELADAPLAIVLRELPDTLVDQESGKPKRQLTFVMAAIARHASATGAQQADDHADRLHCHASSVIRSAQGQYGSQQPGLPRLRAPVEEQSVVFKVEGLDVDGALAASTWAIKYQ